MKIIKILFLAILFLLPLQSKAESKLQIVASVGDQAITNIDLVNRIKIMIISSGLDSSPEVIQRIKPQVLQNLINEKLEITEAKKQGLEANNEEITKALADIETRNKMQVGGLAIMLGQNNVPISSLKDQLSAEISWARIKGKRIAPRVLVSDDELNDFLKAQNYTSYRREYFINEIVLPVENSADEAKIKQLADKLKAEIDSGKDFASIARQFSQSPSVQNGGEVGWLSENQIPQEILQALKATPANTVPAPIRSVEGYYIVKSTATRVTETNLGKNFITARQYNSESAEKLTALKDFSQACITPADFAKKNQLQFKEYNNIRVRELSDGVRGALANLEVGGISKPLPDGKTFAMFVLCEKNSDVVNTFSDTEKDGGRDFLFRRKLELESRKFLRSLRAGTNIEIK